MRAIITLAACLALAAPASAADIGCDKLSWNLDTERAALRHPAESPSGSLPLNAAIALTTEPATETKFVIQPERSAKGASTRGAVARFAAPGNAGEYFVTIADNAWVDIIQDNRFLKPNAFTGALECPGIRKSLRVRLDAKPFVIQLSDVAPEKTAVMITPAR